MKSKEVEECIDILKLHAKWNGNTHCLKTVLAYIEELEQNSVSKDKIRKMKNELNEEFEKNNSFGIYGNDYYIESEKYAFVEEKLNELLEE